MVRKFVSALVGKNASGTMRQEENWRLTREHQGCPYPGAHQKEEKERNLFFHLSSIIVTQAGGTYWTLSPCKEYFFLTLFMR
jgi:hypothetical protein